MMHSHYSASRRNGIPACDRRDIQYNGSCVNCGWSPAMMTTEEKKGIAIRLAEKTARLVAIRAKVAK